MRHRVSPVAAALALAFAGFSVGDATASGAPRFDLDDSAWQATHVVVATEGQSIDGQLTALETWAGPLASGDEIHLPRLSPSALSASRRVHEGLRVSGTRMVLFLDLKHDAASKAWTSESDLDENAVCWIEEGKVHAMIGRGSRDGPLIGPLRMSELALRARVLRLVEMRDALAALRDTTDLEQRLAGTASFVNPDDNYFVQREVFGVLSTCGKAAVPLLVSHLDGRLAVRACRALGAIGDPCT